MSELLTWLFLAFLDIVVVEVLLKGPGQLLLVLFKQRNVGDEPDLTAIFLSLVFWLALGLCIWLLVAII